MDVKRIVVGVVTGVFLILTLWLCLFCSSCRGYYEFTGWWESWRRIDEELLAYNNPDVLSKNYQFQSQELFWFSERMLYVQGQFLPVPPISYVSPVAFLSTKRLTEAAVTLFWSGLFISNSFFNVSQVKSQCFKIPPIKRSGFMSQARGLHWDRRARYGCQ